MSYKPNTIDINIKVAKIGVFLLFLFLFFYLYFFIFLLVCDYNYTEADDRPILYNWTMALIAKVLFYKVTFSIPLLDLL